MSWKKHFRTYRSPVSDTSGQQHYNNSSQSSVSKIASFLPEIYAGHPNRIQRYYQYEDMGRDSDVSAALDTIADFCTQSEEQVETPFNIVYNQKPSESEVKVIKESLTRWLKVSNIKSRLWKIFRDAIQFGDAFFIRDPETGEWYWVDHYAVELVKMSSDGSKKPEEYVIKNFDPNISAKFGTAVNDIAKYRDNNAAPISQTKPIISAGADSNFQMIGTNNDARRRQLGANGMYGGISSYTAINADNLIHLSMSEGMDPNWPFGKSILETVFKTYKQKEMLEDSILIYRVQRAPERRIFYIDVGDANPVKAKQMLEQIKNEIHQRRIPNKTGGGGSVLDSAYNPMSMLDDFYFSTTSEGRGSKVEVLPGGDANNDISDLSYFTKKMARGLRIPTSYLSLSDDEAPAAFNDGKMGQALIQEFRFNKYCMRLQALLAPKFENDFKKFMEDNGVSIDSELFELQFNPPQNFTKYRQIELDQQQTQIYSSLQGVKTLSERYKLQRYLNMTEDEILENERMWAEENAAKFKETTGNTPADTNPDGDLGAIGLRPEDSFGMDDFSAEGGGDMSMEPEPAPDTQSPATPPPTAPDGGNAQ